MQISVVGHSHAAFPPERATLHLRLGVEGTDKQAALDHTTSLVQSFTKVVDQGLLGDDSTSPASRTFATAAMQADSSGEGESVAVIPEDVELDASIHARFITD